jgi:CRISPR-associated protein Cmr2
MPGTLPHVSTAVLFFHYHASIQQAMSQARALLEAAKERVRGKHALAVGYLRRSGVAEASIQPWQAYDGKSSAELFRLFRRDAGHRLSPRLLADLDRDAQELASLTALSERVYRQEIARLVRRHMEGDGGRARDAAAREIAGALVHLGEQERSLQDGGVKVMVRPQPAARVGVFLRQEAR